MLTLTNRMSPETPPGGVLRLSTQELDELYASTIDPWSDHPATGSSVGGSDASVGGGSDADDEGQRTPVGPRVKHVGIPPMLDLGTAGPSTSTKGLNIFRGGILRGVHDTLFGRAVRSATPPSYPMTTFSVTQESNRPASDDGIPKRPKPADAVRVFSVTRKWEMGLILAKRTSTCKNRKLY